MNGRFKILPLNAEHNRSDFSSHNQALNRYFHQQVNQDIRRRVTACYVAIENETGLTAGYYTLAAGSIPLNDMPAELVKQLPRYKGVPVARLGRLAVDACFCGIGLGGALLWDAAIRAVRSEVAVFALVVDAKDVSAVDFYRHHGFLEFGSLANQLILPLSQRILETHPKNQQ